MVRNSVYYFKRFKSDIQRKDSEIIKNSKYYNKSLHNVVDLLSEYVTIRKNGKFVSDIFTIFDLESQVKLYCMSCYCSNDYKPFCANNIIASLQSKKDVNLLKSLYLDFKCSPVFVDLNQNFVEFGLE